MEAGPGDGPLFEVEVDGELVWKFFQDRVEFIDLFEGVFEIYTEP
ncbi:MAG: hypothetical protein QXJ71_07500 [Pyrobaculum sp.]